MIRVKNTDPQLNENQERMLAGCPPEQRRLHELLFSYGNAADRYHRESREFDPTMQDWEEWLEGLPEPMRSHFRSEGFEACRSVLSFTRYVMEKNDIGMDEYIRRLMGDADHAEYRALLSKD